MDLLAEETMAETSEAISGSETEVISEMPFPSESSASIMSIKQSKTAKQGDKQSGATKSKNIKAQNLEASSVPKNKILKRKADHPPTSEMVMESIKVLKKRNGATYEDIKKHMEANYPVNMNMLKHHVKKFLEKSVNNEVLEKIDGAGMAERFKIKKKEKVKKDLQNLRGKELKKKPAKKLSAPKKQIKK